MVIKNVYRPVKASEKDNIRKDTKIHGVSMATPKNLIVIFFAQTRS